MKTLIKFSFVFVLLAFFVSCKDYKSNTAKTGDAVNSKATPTATAKTYSNIVVGTINWIGSKKVGSIHSGTLTVESGTLAAEGSKLKSGDFVIDMASLKNNDMGGSEQGKKLEGHLKSADFFDVAEFPKASFSITSVVDIDTDSANCNITGNLTLKGKTKSITFPALVVAKADGTLEAISDKFSINRTDWGVIYGSGLVGAVGNKIINDDVQLRIKLIVK